MNEKENIIALIFDFDSTLIYGNVQQVHHENDNNAKKLVL